MLLDSHSHTHNVSDFGGATATELLSRAVKADVRKIVTIGTSFEDSKNARDFALKGSVEAQKNMDEKCEVFWTYGVHPSEFEKYREEPDFSKDRPIAIGEVGLDYHYDPEYYMTDEGPFAGKNLSFEEIRTEQIKLLEEMIDLAVRNDLPLSFHVREAFDDFLSIIDNFPKARGVIHSFSDNKKNLKKVLERGFYIGVNGMATYSTLPMPPLDRILTETDAPWLAPVPHRHEINESSYISHIVDWLAEQLKLSKEEVAAQIEKNFKDLFGA